MADDGFQDLAQRAHFIMKGAARRRLAGRGRAYAVHAVVLNCSDINLRQAHLAKERDQVEPQADAVPFNPLGAALTFGDDGIFLLELRGGLGASARVFSVFINPAASLPRSPRSQSSANAFACASPVSLVLVRYWRPFREVEQCQVRPPRR